MGFFERFFRAKSEREENYSNEEENDNWADPITTGWEYTCNLFLKTPKICLENDGLISEGLKKPELFGEPNQIGPDGEPSGNHGFWTRRMGHEEEFDRFENISEDIIYSRESDIGKIPHKSDLERDYKSFLIDFRKIVESYLDIEEKLFKINSELSIKSKSYSRIYFKLVENRQFPDSFFQKELCVLNGVTEQISLKLWNAGYLTPQYVLNAPDEELLYIEGMNLDLIRKIKNKHKY
tara:strand:- start:38 stop:748 length:711 start_codon:yes stop_codon:yes gene_type:complete